MHDWWSPIIGTVIGFLTAWGVLQLTEHRRRKRAQAVTRRAVVAELRHTELVLSSVIVNLSIGTDAVADAVPELKVLLEVGTERILRIGVLDLTADQLETFRARKHRNRSPPEESPGLAHATYVEIASRLSRSSPRSSA